MYTREFEFAKNVALNVGTFLSQQKVKRIDSLYGKDIKLELDRISEDKIIKALDKNFDYAILGEESGLTKRLLENQPYWIIDPIDGTMNFSRNNSCSCISIALFKDFDPVFGIIYDFNRNELFSGLVGAGAWLNAEIIEPSTNKEKSQAILATGFPISMSDDETILKRYILKMQTYKKIRMIGSAALSLAYVACGRFDAYMEDSIKLWDIAAGIAINKAVGNNIEINYLNDYLVDVNVF